MEAFQLNSSPGVIDQFLCLGTVSGYHHHSSITDPRNYSTQARTMTIRPHSILTPLILILFGYTAAFAAEKPNFVFIIADDCTFRDIGCYGGQAHTPNIDRLATEGMRMTQCFQTAPMCSPTRHNIYTGLYPVKSGAYPNHTFAMPGTKSIVHYLKPLGYRVHLSGKRHIAPKEIFPFEYSGKKNNPDMNVIDQLMSEAADEKKPFCLFACSNEPHTPWNLGDPSRYDAAKVKLPPYIPNTPFVRDHFTKYLAEITYFDGQVGQILELLNKHKLTENTMVMVVSEQGNSLPFAKWTCYEAGLGSAMIVRWPDKIKAGSESDAIVEYCDVTPTFVEAAGETPAANLDGKSFLPLLLGKTTSHKNFTYGLMTTRGIINGNESYPIRSIRNNEYRLIWNLEYQEKFQNACTKSLDFQSMLEAAANGDQHAKEFTNRYQHRPEFELYDVKVDPHNLTNLAENPEHKETIAMLKKELNSWIKSQGDRGIATELEAKKHQGRGKKKKQPAGAVNKKPMKKQDAQ